MSLKACRPAAKLFFTKTITVAPFDDLSLFTYQHLDLLAAVNESLELKCLLLKHSDELSYGESTEYCPFDFDSILCWPRTPRNTLAVIPCLEEFQGVQYDSAQNATRYCNSDGVWSNHTNYDLCLHVPHSSAIPEFVANIELAVIIYYVGYTISLVSLTLAVIVFLYLKELRCLRNTIHTNLFITYIMSALLWIFTLSVQILVRMGYGGCIIMVIFFHYFILTNFFWMLVEGFYLYILVVETFSGSNIRFNVYAVIGWGCPAIFVGIWAIAKGLTFNNTSSYDKLHIECPWMHETSVDWIFQGPVCVVLIVNLIFLLRIMWVLITKLRSANTLETRQYRKAAKALLVLIPLFGITYLLVLAGPNEGVGSHIFSVIRALLLSTQGFSVSLFYCFLNSEVRTALRHHIGRWRDERNIQLGHLRENSVRYTTKSSSHSKNYSPRSRTESIRPLTASYQLYGKRESCTSSTTTTTLLGPPPLLPAAQQRGSNGALHMHQQQSRAISPLMQQGLEENSI